MENSEDRRDNRIKMLDKDDEEQDRILDKSAYGEFIPTFHGWAGFEEQLKSAERIYRITGKKRG